MGRILTLIYISSYRRNVYSLKLGNACTMHTQTLFLCFSTKPKRIALAIGTNLFGSLKEESSLMWQKTMREQGQSANPLTKMTSKKK